MNSFLNGQKLKTSTGYIQLIDGVIYENGVALEAIPYKDKAWAFKQIINGNPVTHLGQTIRLVCNEDTVALNDLPEDGYDAD